MCSDPSTVVSGHTGWRSSITTPVYMLHSVFCSLVSHVGWWDTLYALTRSRSSSLNAPAGGPKSVFFALFWRQCQLQKQTHTNWYAHKHKHKHTVVDGMCTGV